MLRTMKHLLFSATILLLSISLISPAAGRRRKPKERPQAKAWLVASLDGRHDFVARNADQVRSIASLSKMMAILVVLDHGLKLDGMTKLIPHDWVVAKGGCRTRLKRNKLYSNRDLLHAAVLGSDNRAIPALGRAVGLNAESMVLAMNRRARRMGLKHTHFKEPTGISYDNVSTAREVLIILRAASRNRILSHVMQTETYTVVEKTTKQKVIYNNTNILTRKHSRKIIAGKTGFNAKAGYCLATAMERKDVGKVGFIILGSTGMLRRFNDYHLLNQRFTTAVAKLPKSKMKSLVARTGRSRRLNRTSKKASPRVAKKHHKVAKRHRIARKHLRKRSRKQHARKQISLRKHRMKRSARR